MSPYYARIGGVDQQRSIEQSHRKTGRTFFIQLLDLSKAEQQGHDDVLRLFGGTTCNSAKRCRLGVVSVNSSHPIRERTSVLSAL